MTIKYEVLVKDADKGLIEQVSEEYCCYGSIGRKFKFTERTDKGFKTTRRFSAGSFQGIVLVLNDHNSPYGQATNYQQRMLYQRMLAELGMYRWLGVGANPDMGTWFKQKRDEHGSVISFTFKKNCPMFLVLAVTGIWRMFANARHLPTLYRALTRLGIHPIVAYNASVQVDASSLNLFNGNTVAKNTFKICQYQTHMPWGFRCMDTRATSRLMHLTHEDFKSLPGMYDEQKETDSLSYNGRDHWFFGTKLVDANSGSVTYSPPRKIPDADMNYLESQEWKKQHCISTDGTTDWYAQQSITGKSLLDWCVTLQKEAELLKGYDLQVGRAQTRANTNEAKVKAAAE